MCGSMGTPSPPFGRWWSAASSTTPCWPGWSFVRSGAGPHKSSASSSSSAEQISGGIEMSDDEIRGLMRQMSRRDVLKWTVYAGTTAGALSLIEACGGSSTSTGGGASGGTPANQQVQTVYAAQRC